MQHLYNALNSEDAVALGVPLLCIHHCAMQSTANSFKARSHLPRSNWMELAVR